MAKDFRKDFYAVQSRQWKISILLFILLFVAHFLLLFLFSVIVLLLFSFLLFIAESSQTIGHIVVKVLIFDLGMAVVIAFFHYIDAYYFGSGYILKRLRAASPDPRDRYHKQFENVVDEIRIAAGLPKVTCYVIPSFAVNSFALMGSDRVPVVVVTEGLLADCTRDELQGAVAHELAHIIRGDAFYMTLVCSMVNFFERIRQALEPEETTRDSLRRETSAEGEQALLYAVAFFCTILMKLLSTLISRHREVMADATAVELCRNPIGLAGAIYKAHRRFSNIGDFNQTYAPIFIVDPNSKGTEDEGFLDRIFNSHPSLSRRLEMLAEMADSSPVSVVSMIKEAHEKRIKHREMWSSVDERDRPDGSGAEEDEKGTENKPWMIKNSKGIWEGPFSLKELMFIPYFTPMIKIRNLEEEQEAPAMDFKPVSEAFRKGSREGRNKCPRCNVTLNEEYYEGVPVLSCVRCGGKLVDNIGVNRIITRHELEFSEYLLKKAAEFEEKYWVNPQRFRIKGHQLAKKVLCPGCGLKMMQQPFSYQYFIMVDKCLSCNRIWFDGDELEILQIMIESRVPIDL